MGEEKNAGRMSADGDPEGYGDPGGECPECGADIAPADIDKPCWDCNAQPPTPQPATAEGEGEPKHIHSPLDGRRDCPACHPTQPPTPHTATLERGIPYCELSYEQMGGKHGIFERNLLVAVVGECFARPERAPEYARYIVQAVNSHAALVEALEGLFRECVMMHKYGGDACNRKEADAAVAAAHAALKLAGK